MWQSIDYKGFEIQVLLHLKYLTPTHVALYSYFGYVHKVCDGIAIDEQRLFFSHPLPSFAEEDALRFAYEEGQLIIDGLHPIFSLKVCSNVQIVQSHALM
ncbi:hypothetical protein [Collimonas sp.]|jgi:hypothetical protein|uniref:hypothetical protein n=1 Tax=Collimonas sp. TaxID=1963772 RepID=UPI002B95A8B5|nr:hypothetical protein [Collimonas sp.]HWX01388.1 hypothetical protein [Collimonas sp.]